MTERFANYMATTLASSISAVATSLTVASATGFPESGNFRILIGAELFLVTAVSGSTWTVTRGAEGTAAATHDAGNAVVHVLTAEALTTAIAEEVATLTAGSLSDLTDVAIGTPLSGNTLVYDDGAWYNAAPLWASNRIMNRTIDPLPSFILAEPTGEDLILTLPVASGLVEGIPITIARGGPANAFVVIITPDGTDKINGASMFTLTDVGESATLVCNSSQAGGYDWYVASTAGMDKFSTINVAIDGTTGIKADAVVDFACEIISYTLLATDQAGDIVIDIWKDTFANFPPTDADSITASAPPTLSTAAKSADATLTGWTTTIAAGDVLRFNVDSVATLTKATLALKVRRT